jgi:hypothetical protein
MGICTSSAVADQVFFGDPISPPAGPLNFANAGEPREWGGGLDFAAVNRAALARLPDILARWLPGGRRVGHEHVARNPTRDDRRPGSFKVNLVTGAWCDFATGDKGGDPVSLTAYLDGCLQSEAARRLARMLGLGWGR